MSLTFYNEIAPYPAQWLRHLMNRDAISYGHVDEGDIQDIQPDAIRDGYHRAHFFSGIGIWDAALTAAGWSTDYGVTWTGSCPCQPFSAAGKRGGFADEQHLWPAWFHLIHECRPAIVFGEQVASPDGLQWFDFVSADLEGAGYAVGASDLCAAGSGGAHIRQRLYFVGVANAIGERRAGIDPLLRPETPGRDAGAVPETAGDGPTGGVADTSGQRWERGEASARGHESDGSASLGAQGQYGAGVRGASGLHESSERSRAPRLGRHVADWLLCRDGKWRPVEPGTFPLAATDSKNLGRCRADRLRGYGNALDLETAVTFVRAVKAILDNR
jgi:DNA (cytosine-5)-methyltransferase 1